MDLGKPFALAGISNVYLHIIVFLQTLLGITSLAAFMDNLSRQGGGDLRIRLRLILDEEPLQAQPQSRLQLS